MTRRTAFTVVYSFMGEVSEVRTFRTMERAISYATRLYGSDLVESGSDGERELRIVKGYIYE